MKLSPIKSNMTEVEIGNKTILFSYKTPVAYKQNDAESINEMFFRTEKKWSVTTSRHINYWIRTFGFDTDESMPFARLVSQEFLDGLV